MVFLGSPFLEGSPAEKAVVMCTGQSEASQDTVTDPLWAASPRAILQAPAPSSDSGLPLLFLPASVKMGKSQCQANMIIGLEHKTTTFEGSANQILGIFGICVKGLRSHQGSGLF